MQACPIKPYASMPYANTPHAITPDASMPYASMPDASMPHAITPHAITPDASIAWEHEVCKPVASWPHLSQVKVGCSHTQDVSQSAP